MSKPQTTVRQPYCKVCHDAGKKDYNKHGLKDKDGNTTCPYLLSLQCNYCKEFGHTQKYCKKTQQTNTSAAQANDKQQANDKFCGFCYKVDKNDPSYKTHYVRKIKDDPDSEITCPRLKLIRCNYCHELGHTVVNCSKRKLLLAYDNRINSNTKNNVEENDNDDDDYTDDDDAITTIAETTTVAETTPKKSTWVTLASKKKICDAPIPLTRCLTRFGIETKPLEKQTDVVSDTVCDAVKTPIIYKKITSWADDDSDDE